MNSTYCMKMFTSQLIPDIVRKHIKKVYYRIPLKCRIGNRYWQIKRFLQKSQWWYKNRIEEWQLNRLREIVKYAYGNVPGYHSLYRAAGVKPKDIETLSDIKILPFVTKEMIRDNLEEFTSKAVPKGKRIYGTTGGSTGIPFGFYHTISDEIMEKAFMHLGWERAGWDLGDSCAILRGAFVGSEERYWDFAPDEKELLLSTYYLTEKSYDKYISKISEFRPVHLKGYPSAVTILADLILEKEDVGRINFKAILLGSENIYEWQKR
ncbi:MAG: hypothetical protein ACFFCW_22360, partial [Candidatus Hodarchaeota archaeon]